LNRRPGVTILDLLLARSAAAALILAVLLARCSSGTGPGLDDPLQFTARINGAAWAPADSARTLAFWRSDSVLFVGGIRTDQAGRAARALDALGVQAAQFTGPGVYSLGDDPLSSNGEYLVYDQAVGGIAQTFRTTAPTSGQIRVTEVDTLRHLIAGVFSFQTQEVGGSTRVAVSHGAFRLTYQPTLAVMP
jgi:hypothetical protein